jgi:hypothetical protein
VRRIGLTDNGCRHRFDDLCWPVPSWPLALVSLATSFGPFRRFIPAHLGMLLFE